MKKLYLGLLITLILSTAINAQIAKFAWARSMGGTSSEYGYSITTDASGNAYVTGRTGFDIFVKKLDGSGNSIWTHIIGGLSWDEGKSITTDASGNVYITGIFQFTVDFDPGIGTFNLTSNAGNVFILKLDTDGNFIWAKSIGHAVNSITIDPSGNVYVTGSYQGTVDFDPGANIFNLTSNGNFAVFILKLDTGGNFIWAKSMGGSSDAGGNSLTANASGDLYVAGYFRGTVDFDPGVDSFKLTSKGAVDAYIQKLDTGGNFIWARSMGGLYSDHFASIATDASGNLYAVGSFAQDIFVQKLNSSGDSIWANSFGGIGIDWGRSITTDASGNVYVTGSYQETVDFDPGPNIFSLTARSNPLNPRREMSDIYIQKLDASGNFVWAISIGDTLEDHGHSITTDALGNVYATGTYWGVVDFDPSEAIFNLTSNIYEGFVLKLNSTVGIEENTFFNSVSIFPNPNQGLINIDLGNLKGVSIKVFSILGQLLYHKENIDDSIHQFELNEAAGVYILEVSSQGEKQQYKVVKM